jgi:hypothetical protein
MAAKKYRVQIDLSEQGYHDLERLIEECGFSTKKEFFDNAISLVRWAADKAKSGRSIASIDEKEKQYNELEMPFLQKLRARVTDYTSRWAAASH